MNVLLTVLEIVLQIELENGPMNVLLIVLEIVLEIALDIDQAFSSSVHFTALSLR